MSIGAIIQARMSSKRFPGKVLHEVGGKPMMQYLIESIEHCATIDQIVVATSIKKSDDLVSAFCQEFGVPCFRGAPWTSDLRMAGFAAKNCGVESRTFAPWQTKFMERWCPSKLKPHFWFASMGFPKRVT